MGISISFNLQKNTDTKSKLSGIDKHNHRKYTRKSLDNSDSAINFELSKYNQILVGTKNLYQDVRKVYKEEFGKAVEEYNETQKRKDRKIYDYFEKISTDGRRNLFTQINVQIGDQEFWKDKNIDDRKKMVDVFEKQLELIREHYPNFKIANAVVHLDETSPHMHVVGVCSSNEELSLKNLPNEKRKKKNLLKQYVSQREVFTQFNMKTFHEEFSKKSLDFFNEKYNLNEVLNDKRIHQEHLELAEYKRLAPFIRKAQKEKDDLKKEKENLKIDVVDLKNQKETFEKENKNLDFALENLKKEKEKIESLRNKIKTNKSDLELLVSVYEDLYKQKIMFSDNYKLTKEQLDFLLDKAKKVDKLEDENSDLSFKNDRLKFENSRLDNENYNLKKEKIQEKDFSISKYDLEMVLGKEQLKKIEDKIKEISNFKIKNRDDEMER